MYIMNVSNKQEDNTMKNTNTNEKFYMHVETGSVDTEENWVSTIETETDDLKNFKEGTTAQEAFDEYCRDGKFVEVEKDEDGDWKEVQ